MFIVLTIIHVLVCLFLIIVVLLQSGKAADIAGAFGGMGSQTAFGPRGSATLLSKATTIAAILFMITCIWLGIEQGRQRGVGDSVIERTGTGTAAPAPAQPADKGSTVPSITTETIPAGSPESTPAPAAPAAPQSGTPAPQEKAPAKTP